MKHLFLLLLLCVLTASAFAQDRAIAPRRTFQPSPDLMTLQGTDDAAGLAQTPAGYPLPLNGSPIPARSLVGILGHELLKSGANQVLLWSNNGIQVIEAKAVRDLFPGLERIVFRLPADLHGDVWVATVGRQSSNVVKIIVE